MSRARTMKVVATALTATAVALPLALAACGSDHEVSAVVPRDASLDRAAPPPLADAAPRDAATVDAPAGDAAVLDAGPCNVRIDAIPLADSPHVPDDAPIVYSSNPPSSGPHYATWANFQELTHPVADGYLVHSMEHGAVLLLYECPAPGAACDALVAALRAVRDALPADPLCDPAIRVRIVLAARAGNGATVAAAAWGNIYRADCMDAPSLTSFVLDHYAKAPENLCVAGQVF